MPHNKGSSASISVLELSTYHHEVVVAFCNHVLSAGINVQLLLPPKGGLRKTLFGIAAKSHQDLKGFAATNDLRIVARKTRDEKALAKFITSADSLFIATLPRFASEVENEYARTNSHDILLDSLKLRLSEGRQTYITIHKPHDELPRLKKALSAEELNAIRFVALSPATQTAISALLSNPACQVLVMPVVSTPASPATNAAQPHRMTIVIPGEVSTKRRDYNKLCELAPRLKAVGSRHLQVQIMGRLKRESWREKLLFLLPLPTSMIFLLRHPRLQRISRQGCLDVSRIHRRKLSDTEFSEAIENCSALLDVQQPHYDQYGITSGLFGLSLTHAKPTLKPGELSAMLAQGNADSLHYLRMRLIDQSNELAAMRDRLTKEFRRNIAEISDLI